MSNKMWALSAYLVKSDYEHFPFEKVLKSDINIIALDIAGGFDFEGKIYIKQQFDKKPVWGG